MSGWSAVRSEAAAMTRLVPPTRGRRDLLAGLLGLGLLPGQAWPAAGEGAFDATSLAQALQALGGVPVASADGIVLSVPDVSENGAVVPVAVTSRLARTSEIALVVESNPQPLVVRFTIPEGTEPFVSTRIKMARSGNVYAVVRSDGKLYSACRQAQVTVGGCG